MASLDKSECVWETNASCQESVHWSISMGFCVSGSFSLCQAAWGTTLNSSAFCLLQRTQVHFVARITQTSKWKSFSVLNARFSCKKALEFYMHLFSKACNRSKISIWALRDKAEVTMEQQHLLRCTTRAIKMTWRKQKMAWSHGTLLHIAHLINNTKLFKWNQHITPCTQTLENLREIRVQSALYDSPCIKIQ